MITMTNDEAQDFLASQTKPEDAGRLGAAIRAIRTKAIADAKEWFGPDDLVEQIKAIEWHDLTGTIIIEDGPPRKAYDPVVVYRNRVLQAFGIMNDYPV